MKQLKMMLCSVEDLISDTVWLRFLQDLESFIGVKLSHLDSNDPVRKKVISLEEASKYICDIAKNEKSRTLFAKFGKSKVEMTVTLYRDLSDSCNIISVYFPEKFSENEQRVGSLCGLLNILVGHLKPFYAVCDYSQVIAKKKKATGYAVDLQAELIGVFWLTYFSESYVDYFGREKFFNITGCEEVNGGLLLRLADLPDANEVDRIDVELMLNADSFVNPGLQFDKPAGKSALRFSELKN